MSSKELNSSGIRLKFKAVQLGSRTSKLHMHYNLMQQAKSLISVCI